MSSRTPENTRRVRRDGPGWGVEVYSERYGWYFENDEPFATRSEAQFYLTAGVENQGREEDRRDWARGFLSPTEDQP